MAPLDFVTDLRNLGISLRTFDGKVEDISPLGLIYIVEPGSTTLYSISTGRLQDINPACEPYPGMPVTVTVANRNITDLKAR